MRALTLLLALLGGQALSAVSCTVSVTGMDFGLYLSSTVKSGTGQVSVACEATRLLDLGLVSVTVSLSAGQSGTYAGRFMSSGGHRLTYSLSTPLGAPWGDGTQGTGVVSSSFNLASVLTPISRTWDVIGFIPSGQVVPAGTYTDSVTVTLAY